jgi:hypothetical protein
MPSSRRRCLLASIGAALVAVWALPAGGASGAT